jgi:hypothetical protein
MSPVLRHSGKCIQREVARRMNGGGMLPEGSARRHHLFGNAEVAGRTAIDGCQTQESRTAEWRSAGRVGCATLRFTAPAMLRVGSIDR